MEDRGSVVTIAMNINGDEALDQSEPLIKEDSTETPSMRLTGGSASAMKSKSSTPDFMSSPGSAQNASTPRGATKRGKHTLLARLTQGRRRVGFREEGRDASLNVERPCKSHCYHTEVTDVREMEEGLMTLLSDFHSGKLQAFGSDGTMQQMEAIREQQEKLARLHFDLSGGRDFSPDLSKPLSDDCLRQNRNNMTDLSKSLQELSDSIEKLHGREKEDVN